MRQLATIQKIIDIKPIEGADKIELCYIKGWQVVCKRGEYHTGDFCIYIEIDSVLPETLIKTVGLWDETKNKGVLGGNAGNRVKTKKFRGALSQGLVVPMSVLPNPVGAHEDLDVTDLLGIVKYDPQIQEEKSLVSIPKHKNKVLRFCMGFKPFRTVYFKLNTKEHGDFPSFVSKTDEENIQNMVNVITNNFEKSFYVTEKLEGQSGSFFTYNARVWGFNRRCFGVASRNVWLRTPDNSNYWKVAKKYGLEGMMKSHDINYTIQGEQIGPGIQGNIYKLPEVELRVFNLIVDGVRKNYVQMKAFCELNGIGIVPLLDGNFIPAEHIKDNDRASIVKYLLDYSNGTSVLYPTKREGVVLRVNDMPWISVKARSPDYLIEHGE